MKYPFHTHGEINLQFACCLWLWCHMLGWALLLVDQCKDALHWGLSSLVSHCSRTHSGKSSLPQLLGVKIFLDPCLVCARNIKDVIVFLVKFHYESKWSLLQLALNSFNLWLSFPFQISYVAVSEMCLETIWLASVLNTQDCIYSFIFALSLVPSGKLALSPHLKYGPQQIYNFSSFDVVIRRWKIMWVFFFFELC